MVFQEVEMLESDAVLDTSEIEIDEQLFLLRDEEKRCSAAFGRLITERQNAHSVLKCNFGQRDKLNPKIQAKIAAKRQECFWSDCAGEWRVTSSRTACYPRVLFLWLSVFVLVLCITS